MTDNPSRPQIRYKTPRRAAGDVQTRVTKIKGTATFGARFFRRKIMSSPFVCDENGVMTRVVSADANDTLNLALAAVKEKVLLAVELMNPEERKSFFQELENVPPFGARIAELNAKAEIRKNNGLDRLRSWIKNRETGSEGAQP